LAAKSDPISVKTLVNFVGLKGHFILIFLLAIPFLQPIPLLGLSSLVGLVIVLVCVNVLIGLKPWLPDFVLKRNVPAAKLLIVCKTARKLIGHIEHIIKPRAFFISEMPILRHIVAIQIIFSALILALPLPIPGSNMIAALPIVLLCLGVLEKDGYLILIGMFSFLCCLLFATALIVLPIFGIETLFSSHLKGELAFFVEWIRSLIQ